MKKKQFDIKILSYNGNDKVRNSIKSSDLKEMCNIYNEYALMLFDIRMRHNILTETSLAHPDWILLSENIDIAKHKGEVVGYVSYTVKESFGRNLVTITNIHVKDAYKRMGVGSKLVRNLFRDYDNGQFTATCVFEDNHEAQSFWKKLGFATKVSSDLFVDYSY